MMTKRSRLFYALALFGYFGIMPLLLAWYGWLAPPRLIPPQLALLALGLPLFAPLRGLLHARPYTVAWSCFLVLLYFTHGVIEAYTSPVTRHLGLLEIVLTSLWFLAALAWIRRHKTAAGPKQA